MLFATAAAVTILLMAYTFTIRRKDLPEPAGPKPWQHLESRKAAIYENLRDLQFEYRLGKLSDDDYSRTKTELQAELAGVLAEIDTLKGAKAPEAVAARNGKAPNTCPHCNATFDRSLKFCGECGKPMTAVGAS
ncbi:MAG TPA: hypothetical protein VES20_00850 [Bryobacteraceae bacterium]|nr:hypothetical protein [Bryobacteraceae bacterium]